MSAALPQQDASRGLAMLTTALGPSIAAMLEAADTIEVGEGESEVAAKKEAKKSLLFRAARIFDQLHVLVVHNPDKSALLPIAHSVVLIHRSNEFRAAPASVAKMRALCDDMKMQLMIGNVTGIKTEGDTLKGINVIGADTVTRVVEFDHLLAFYGLSPKLGPIATWGLGIDKNQITVDTERFETSVPGIYAVGDINTYPGKKKLILCGFHECALAAFGATPFIFPEKKVFLQYTTTSPKLHKVLGVESPVFDD